MDVWTTNLTVPSFSPPDPATPLQPSLPLVQADLSFEFKWDLLQPPFIDGLDPKNELRDRECECCIGGGLTGPWENLTSAGAPDSSIGRRLDCGGGEPIVGDITDPDDGIGVEPGSNRSFSHSSTSRISLFHTSSERLLSSISLRNRILTRFRAREKEDASMMIWEGSESFNTREASARSAEGIGTMREG